MAKLINYVGGINLSGHKRFLKFLFGSESIITAKADNKKMVFVFYFKLGSFNTAERLSIITAYKTEFPSIEVHEI